MANINKIALPDGTQYDIEDTVARGAISNINSFNIQIVQSLPTTNIDSHTIYLLSKSATVGSSTVGDSTVGGENDTYDEYIYVNSAWEKLGDDINTEAFARVEDIPTKVSDLTDDVGMITEWTQSDWEEDDSSDPAYVINRPVIRAGDGENSIVEGDLENNIASGSNSHTEGQYTVASGDRSHAEGFATIASGIHSHSEGTFGAWSSQISGEANATTYTITGGSTPYFYDADQIIGGLVFPNPNPDGLIFKVTNAVVNSYILTSITLETTINSSSALTNYPVKILIHNKSSGRGSHVENGPGSYASGKYSHAEGQWGWSAGNYSHTEGSGTIATSSNQHVQGKYNIKDSSGIYAHIVGNGTNFPDANRSNAHTLDWNGNGWYAGKLTVGAGPTNNMDVATKQYVDSAIPANEVFLVNISYENGTYVADKTYNEATTAFNSGKIVFARDSYNRIFLFGDDGGGTYRFQTFGSLGEINEYMTLSYYYDGTTDYSLSESSYDMNLLSNLGDTNINSPTTGQVLTRQNNRWVNADIPSSSVSSLTDTTITSAANGQVLTYNSSSSKWVNSSIPAQNGSLSMSSNVITLTNASGTTSTIALPVYSGSVSTVGGGS